MLATIFIVLCIAWLRACSRVYRQIEIVTRNYNVTKVMMMMMVLVDHKLEILR